MINLDTFITTNSRQTQELGKLLSKELRGGEILCLSGELGSGKTTFAQGILAGLGAKGPYTSPTFVVMKQYKIKNQKSKIKNAYHIDSYRVKALDILDLGWEELVRDRKNIIIVEWAERIRSIISKRAIWIKFEHLEEDKREISIKS